MKAPWLTLLFNDAFEGQGKVKMGTRREGDTLVMQLGLDTKKMPAAMRAQMKGLPLFDGQPIEARTSVVGDKLLMIAGGDSQQRLTGLAGGAAAPSAALGAALAETKGDDGLYYLDIAAALRPLVGLAASGAMPVRGGPNPMALAGMASTLLKDGHLVTWGAYKGGDLASVTWRIPMSTFESVGNIVHGAMGGGDVH